MDWGSQGTTTRINGGGGSGAYRPWMSGDGRFVAFDSAGTRVVPGDTNGHRDVFVYDRVADTVHLVSKASDGALANGDSQRPTISAEGRLVAFQSTASNLVDGDTNGKNDVFVHDTSTGRTTRVSVEAAGVQANGGSLSPSISADGRFVSFDSSATNLVPGQDGHIADIYVKDLHSGAVTRVTNSVNGGGHNAASHDSSISGDGRFVTYWSDASDLVPGDTNGCADVFVSDRHTGTTKRISVSTIGAQGNGDSFSPALSVDGRFVAFDSKANNLVTDDPTTNGQDIFVHVP